MNNALTIDFAPFLSGPFLYGTFAIIGLFLLLSFFFYKRSIIGRILCAAAFILLFLNPSVVEEQREAVSDIAVIVVDSSLSQNNGDRAKRTEEALSYLQQEITKLPGIDTRIIFGDDGSQRETQLFKKIDQTLSDVPANRRAGVIMITDGQVHDVSKDPGQLASYGPIHTLLSGHKKERDRQLVILKAPSYGIVGQDVTIHYRVQDNRPGDDTHATLLVRQDNNSHPRMNLIPLNQDLELTVQIGHAGQNIFDIDVSAADEELTIANNRLPLIINGIRDRLRVLLVSGQPHAGGRAWRDMLTSDPSVDLVHFTILREPNKLDATPQNELSLIAFPFEELFETKLYDFDLIIFDRYRLNRILPNYYFSNIARYVKEGGALLEASGPSFATENSVYTTELSQILPALPTGQVLENEFKPSLTDTGHRHPVTQSLYRTQNKQNTPDWGSWLRQIAVTPESGEILMTGLSNLPLLILDRVGEGRVAQLASDHIWLWSRGFDGGGPQTELMRRLAHWLMKEPELEENALLLTAHDETLLIQRRSLSTAPVTVTITAPDNSEQAVELVSGENNSLEARVKTDQLGVYTVDDGTKKRFVLAGDINPPELRDILTTDGKLLPAAKESKGRILWLEETDKPHIRLLPPDRSHYGGKGWIGLRKNQSYNVTGTKSIPFLPEELYVLLLLSLIIGCWWLEGRNKPT